jgi:hypothetical protein
MAGPARRRDVSRGRAAPLVFAAAVAVATAALFVVSRGKWSDALIDSGREWIVPDALARGGLLYRDVVYWFGPLTPHVQAVFLRAFGSNYASLVLAGALGASAALALLYAVLRRVSGRREAGLWTALAIPALVFMPNAGGALLGMGYRIWHAAAFTLAGVALAAGTARLRIRLFLAGACAGLAGLCRTEWGLAAIAAVAFACVVRERRRGRGLGDAVIAATGFAAVFGAGLGFFLWRAGAEAVLGDSHVLLTGLPPETRHFLVAFSGVRDWRNGVLELLYSGAMWTGIFLLATLLSRPAPADRPKLLTALGAVLAVLALVAVLGGAGSAVLFSAAPLISLAGLLAGLRRGRGSAAAALSACGLLGLVLSYRRPFHIGDSAYVAPPLLFAFVCAAGLLHLAIARSRTRGERTRRRDAVGWTVAALVAAAFVGRMLGYSSIESEAIAGTREMLSARPELAREIEELSAAVAASTREGDTLVVFPEGEVVNLLSGRRNPIRQKLYLPGYLTDANEAAILEELARASPAAVVLWRRPTSEYDRSLFGEDYGRRIHAWIEENYRLTPFRARGAPARANPRFLLGTRKGGTG